VSVSDTLSHESARAAQIALMTSITDLHLINVDVGEGWVYGLFQQTPPAWDEPAPAPYTASPTEVVDPTTRAKCLRPC
jgi:hypothetical protein